MHTKTINHLVEKNHRFAWVLHRFGVSFYNEQDKTLGQLCQTYRLNLQQILKTFQETSKPTQSVKNFQAYPIELILKYLRHSHTVFINERLPYMAKLIQDLCPQKIGNSRVVSDLQTLFPLFVDEFIEHIHEEEDSLFQYLWNLHQASRGQYSLNKVFYQIEKNLLQSYALEHHESDDDMRGIREITNDYDLGKKSNLHLQVIFAELQSFETELQQHSQVEELILLPKALKLENLVKKMLQKRTQLN